MSVTLFHIEPSLCSQKVRLALAEKGVPHVTRRIDIGPGMENYEPWYVRLNPAAVVPTLLHDDQVITDSARIVRYVDETFPGPRLAPRDPALQAEVGWWIARVDRVAYRTLSYGRAPVPRPMLRAMVRWRLRRLRRLERDHPDLAEAYRRKAADVADWHQGLVDEAMVEAARVDAIGLLDDAEAALSDGRTWLVGAAYSLADLMLTVAVARTKTLGLGDEIDRRPELVSWYARVQARPSFEQAQIMERVPAKVIAGILGRFLLPRLAFAAVVVAALAGVVLLALR